MATVTLRQNAETFAATVCQSFADMVGVSYAAGADSYREENFKPAHPMTAMIHFTGPIQGEYAVSMTEETAATVIGCWDESQGPEALKEMRSDYSGFLKEALNAAVGMAIEELGKDFSDLTFLPAVVIYGELEYPTVPAGSVTLEGDAGEIGCYFVLNMMGLELGDRLQETLQKLQNSAAETTAAKRNVEYMLSAYPSGLVATDLAGTVLPGYARRTATVVGLEQDANLVGMTIPELLNFEDPEGNLPGEYAAWLKVVFERFGSMPFNDMAGLCPLQESLNQRGRVVALEWFPMESEPGKLERLLLLVEDVTDRRRIESEMKRLSKSNEESMELVGQLVNLEPDEVTEFVYDSSGLLTEAKRLLTSQKRSREFIESLFRTIHTLKGNSGQFQFKSLQKLASEIEVQLQDLRVMEAGDDGDEYVTERLNSIDERLKEADGYLQRLDDMRTKLGSRDETAEQKAARSEPTSMVPLREIDNLVLQAGEMYRAARALGSSPILTNSLGLLGGAAARLREVRLGQVAHTFQAVVERLGAKLGKKSVFTWQGDVGLDIEVMRKLHKAFVHLLNNAVDHGLESASQRKSAGKTEVGIVSLSCKEESDQVILVFADDGRGVDLKAARAKISESEGKSEEEISRLNEDEVLARLFFSGFSTKDQVTDTSGRGVGLDVVQYIVNSLQGQIRIRTREGKGTSFEIRIPVTSACPARKQFIGGNHG
ncbi:MAG: hypothetical protein RL318_745 [Fibrobacterota bacterium]|jgi:signal transduction histidine kinase/CheY-specific phosphatase CheX